MIVDHKLIKLIPRVLVGNQAFFGLTLAVACCYVAICHLECWIVKCMLFFYLIAAD